MLKNTIMATNSNLLFDVNVNGHLYHAKIEDNREKRKREKLRGYKDNELTHPYYYTAWAAEENCEVAFVSNYGCYTKPSKKDIIAHIEYEWQKIIENKEKAEKIARQKEEEGKRKEQQRREYEEWLQKPANITNGQLEKIMSQLQSLESRLTELEGDVDEQNRQIRGVAYAISGSGLEE